MTPVTATKPDPKPILPLHPYIQKIFFIVAAVASLTPLLSAPVALFIGILFVNIIGNPFRQWSSKATKILLQISVVGLGFGMNIHEALKAGKEGILFTVISISGTLILGYLLGRLLKIDRKTAHLISSGTAICGGSAIAAIAPVIQADEKQISVSLGTIFILNSIALFLFPVVGHYMQLSETQFGLWCAIAIHDTSSVVGAANKFGPQALAIATTVKLARALWIIPISLVMPIAFKSGKEKIKIPWFIAFFILAMLANTYVPYMAAVTPYLVSFSKAGLTLTLFLIGSGLSYHTLKTVGIRPLLQGIILWVTISVAALYAVMIVL
jgi:uncharacterized integral membrane protein (TIGR00698 family)